MSNWIEIGALQDIPSLGARVVEYNSAEIAVFRTEANEVFAIANRCPHKNGPLAEGLVHDHKVACPLHNWNIDLRTGEVLAPDSGCVQRYEVKLEGERILLAL